MTDIPISVRMRDELVDSLDEFVEEDPHFDDRASALRFAVRTMIQNKEVERKIPVGECPDCGIVFGMSVDLDFPSAATCAECGSELQSAGLAKPARIREVIDRD